MVRVLTDGSVWTKENAGLLHAEQDNNTFTHCAAQVSSTQILSTEGASATVPISSLTVSTVYITPYRRSRPCTEHVRHIRGNNRFYRKWWIGLGRSRFLKSSIWWCYCRHRDWHPVRSGDSCARGALRTETSSPRSTISAWLPVEAVKSTTSASVQSQQRHYP